MKSLNKDFLPVYTKDQVYAKDEVYTKDEVDELISGGGASGLVVTVTYTYDESSQTDLWSLNKNYTEIMTAVNNGITPIFVEDLDGGNVGYHTFVQSFVAENPETGVTTYGIILYAYYTTGVITVLGFSSTSLTGELIGQIITD